MNAMEELEAQFNDVVDRMRKLSEEGRDPGTAYNLSKLSELATRLNVRLEGFRKELVEAGYLADDSEPKPAEPPRRNVPRPAPEPKPGDEPSAPDAGDEPRHGK